MSPVMDEQMKITLLAVQQIAALYLNTSLEKYTNLLPPKDISEQEYGTGW